MSRKTARTAGWLGLAAFLAYVVSGGGRVVGSDEVTMLELSRALLAGTIAVPEGATVLRHDGRQVTKNAAGQAVLALPLVAAAEAGARLTGLPPERRHLAVRFGASFFNAAVTALLLGTFYAGARALGVGAGASLAAALMLGFATPVWVYSKSFMAEPLQSLGLLLALLGASLAATRAPAPRQAQALAGLGAFLAVSVKLTMLPLVIGCLVPLLAVSPRVWLGPAMGLVLALSGHGLYNLARFGNPLETGYGIQATPAAYTTPILVGLYGLLISSGKGALWFAPGLWLAPAGWKVMIASARAESGRLLGRLGLGTAAGNAGIGAVLTCLAALALYSRFQHWAGDGSFGPRYLVPVLPLAFLPVAFALDRRPSPDERPIRRRRTLAVLLGALGFLIQVGGVGIYFGAQMREAGDYPYPLPLGHPRFMSDSHFNPAFTPIAGHWRMLWRNGREHLAGRMPRLGGSGPPDPRLGISEADQRALLHALDLWWLYLIYAGFPRGPVWGALAALVVLTLWAAARARAAFRSEARAP